MSMYARTRLQATHLLFFLILLVLVILIVFIILVVFVLLAVVIDIGGGFFLPLHAALGELLHHLQELLTVVLKEIVRDC